MKIGVVTFAIGDDYKSAVFSFRKSLVMYCEKHSYPLHTETDVFDGEREPLWYKIKMLQRYLDDYDYVVWIDADLMIMRHEVPLSYFIMNYMNDKDLMISEDHGNQYNTGVMFLKKSDWNRKLLNVIYNLPEIAGRFHEQGVLTELYNRDVLKIREHTRLIPESCCRLFNPTPSVYRWGDFLVHFMGVKRPPALGNMAYTYYPFSHGVENDEAFVNRINELEQRHSHNNCRYFIPKTNLKIGVCYFVAGDKYTDNTTNCGRMSLKIHCMLHGYDFLEQTTSLVPTDEDGEPTLPPHWNKMPLIRKYLDDYDYLVWIDADIMIMNHNIRWEDLIVDHMGSDQHFLTCRDLSGHINTGVWIARNSEYAKMILDLNSTLPELRYRECEEQDIFNRIYERDLWDAKKHIAVIDDQTIMNCCVGLYKTGMFLVHFMSLSKPGLSKCLQDFYPFRKGWDNDWSFNLRKNWLNAHYGGVPEITYDHIVVT